MGKQHDFKWLSGILCRPLSVIRLPQHDIKHWPDAKHVHHSGCSEPTTQKISSDHHKRIDQPE
jgi:hypothetical protein